MSILHSFIGYFDTGLTDLYGAQDYVRDTVAGYLNDLVDIGVAG